MHSDIDGLLAVQGFVTRPQLIDRGFTDRIIWDAVRLGTFVRIGVGLFAGPEYAQLSPESRHLVRVRAVMTRFDGRVAVSHQSAALLHGASVWGADLDDVHLTRVDTGRGRHQAGVAHHVADLRDDELTLVDGIPVTTGARTAWDLAVNESAEVALVSTDSLLHLGLAREGELVDLSRRYGAWRGSRRARVTLSLADGRSESAGETRGRWMFRQFGLPRPELQVPVYDDRGRLIGVADYCWPGYRHLAEFDGLLKYGESVDLAKEKWREDRLRAQGWGMTRIVWSQLAPGSRKRCAEELFEAMKQSARVFAA